MKHSKKCPKCGGEDIAVTTGRKGTESNTIMTGISYFGMVACDKFICLNCGYIEQWIHDAAGLKKIAEKCDRLDPAR